MFGELSKDKLSCYADRWLVMAGQGRLRVGESGKVNSQQFKCVTCDRTLLKITPKNRQWQQVEERPDSSVESILPSKLSKSTDLSLSFQRSALESIFRSKISSLKSQIDSVFVLQSIKRLIFYKKLPLDNLYLENGLADRPNRVEIGCHLSFCIL